MALNRKARLWPCLTLASDEAASSVGCQVFFLFSTIHQQVAPHKYLATYTSVCP